MSNYNNHKYDYSREGQLARSRNNICLTVVAAFFLCIGGFFFKECYQSLDSYHKKTENNSNNNYSSAAKKTSEKPVEIKKEQQTVKKEVLKENKIEFSNNTTVPEDNINTTSVAEINSNKITASASVETILENNISSATAEVDAGNNIASVSAEIASKNTDISNSIDEASSNVMIASGSIEAVSENINASESTELASENTNPSAEAEIIFANINAPADYEKFIYEDNLNVKELNIPIKFDKKCIIPEFESFDKQCIYPISLIESRSFNPENNVSVSVKANGIKGADFEKIRQYSVSDSPKNITVISESDKPGFKLFCSSNPNTPQKMIWEVKIENNILLFIRHDNNKITYRITLAGNNYFVYCDNDMLTARVYCHPQNNILEIQKFDYPCKSVYIKYDEKTENKFIYSHAVMAFDDLSIDIRQILFIEALNLEKKYALKNILTKSNIEADFNPKGIIIANNKNFVHQAFVENVGEHFLGYYELASGVRTLKQVIQSLKLNDENRAYLLTDFDKKTYPLIKFMPAPDGFMIRYFNSRFIGKMTFKDDEISFRNETGKVKYRFYENSNNKNEFLIDNVRIKELFGSCLSSESNTDDTNFYCEYNYSLGERKWEKAGYYLAPLKDTSKYMSAIPGILLFREYDEFIKYCIFNESSLYALEHPGL